jgi:hypothetical protein
MCPYEEVSKKVSQRISMVHFSSPKAETDITILKDLYCQRKANAKIQF